eukprot:PLAT4783.1.p2 GENE.PLAT4783.1~~PLAT4783.1.p2  ORF type:complete len:484 (-),score=212.33 PLAT4783.1:46-1497(-)
MAIEAPLEIEQPPADKDGAATAVKAAACDSSGGRGRLLCRAYAALVLCVLVIAMATHLPPTRHAPVWLAWVLLITPAILYAIGRYMWLRLLQQPALPPRLSGRGRCALLSVGWLALLVGAGAANSGPAVLQQGVNFGADFLWALAIFVMWLLTVLPLVDIALLCCAAAAARMDRPPQAVRAAAAAWEAPTVAAARKRLAATSLLSALLLLWSLLEGAAPAAVIRVSVPLRGLPPSAAGYSLGMLCDVHLGATVDRPSLAAAVQVLNEEAVDAVLLVGDLIEGPTAAVTPKLGPLRDLRASDGSFFVVGNHELYWQPISLIEQLRKMNVTVLRNDAVQLPVGAAHNDSFDLIGVDDWSVRDEMDDNGFQANLTAALERAAAAHSSSGARASVLMAHQPNAAPQAVAAGVGLTLSGHVHGGQLLPLYVLNAAFNSFFRGLYAVGDAQWVYVSGGTEQWGPRARLGASKEITIVTLLSEDEAATVV